MRSPIVMAVVGLAGCRIDAPDYFNPDATGETADAPPPDADGVCRQQLAFHSNREATGYEIAVINSDSTGRRRLTTNSADDRDPQWSPNRADPRIIFATDRDGNSEIYSIAPDGTDEVNLSNRPDDDTLARWSPTGDQIAFLRAGNIWVMDPTGVSQSQRTTSGDVIGAPAWSPDGTEIVMARSLSGNLEVGRLILSSNTLSNLTNNAAIDSIPSWSPDGSKIIFQSTRGTTGMDLWVMNKDGTNLIQLTMATSSDNTARWSPAGDVIAFTSHRDGNDEVYTMLPSGDDEVNRTLHANRTDQVKGWSSDGALLAFEADGSLWVMPPDGEFSLNLTSAIGNIDEFGSFSPPCP